MDHYKKSYLIILFPLFISGCGNYSSNEDTVDGKIKPIVKSISPSEGETNVDVTTPILLSFSKEIKTNTLKYKEIQRKYKGNSNEIQRK